MAGTAQFTVSEADYVSASRDNFRCQLGAWRFWRRLLLLVLGAYILVTVFLLTSMDWAEALVGGAVSAAIGFVGGMVGMAINYLLLPRRMGRLYRQQRALQQEQVAEWSEAGLRARGDSFTSQMPWRDYHRWHESDGAFLLYINEQMPQFIPKAALSPEQIDDLRSTLVAYGPLRR